MNPAEPETLLSALFASLIVGLVFTVILAAKAIKDYSQAGPQLRREILARYRLYAAWAVGRLSLWVFIISALCAAGGNLLYLLLAVILDLSVSWIGLPIAGALGLTFALTFQFCHMLLYSPAVIAASSHYRISRFYWLWKQLSPWRLRVLNRILAIVGLLLLAGASVQLAATEEWLNLGLLLLAIALLAAPFIWGPQSREPAPVAGKAGSKRRPNILMIGSDTLRADRLGIAGYHRALTPRLDALAARGTAFTNCYVPCGRTAPSLISLLTGTWPHTHGVRDNYVSDKDTALTVTALPHLLAEHGYATVAVSDWCGADFGKFPLGFQILDLPEDPWNIRFLLRQGPKDLRLFLSLFSRNRFGKRFLPEIYYLGGVPLTRQVGRDARTVLSRLAAEEQPFLLNVFLSTTHPPFGSEYPYYTLLSDPGYIGESKFVMARLTDPLEIIRRQGDTKKEFDLNQILDLYDGCVKNFDDEAERLLDHLQACGVADHTIVVIYSDHGMEFFENGTWGQGNSVVGDFSARVPLIIADPRVNGGHRIDSIVRTIDVAPTLLELIGLPPASTMEGVSLARCIEGKAPPALPAFNESGIWLTDLPSMPKDHLRYPNLLHLLEVPNRKSGTLAIKDRYNDLIIEAKDRMIRSGRWKLVYQPTHQGALYRLFDLQIDPHSCTDVSSKYPEVFAELREQLVTWMRADTRRQWSEEHLKAHHGKSLSRNSLGLSAANFLRF